MQDSRWVIYMGNEQVAWVYKDVGRWVAEYGGVKQFFNTSMEAKQAIEQRLPTWYATA